MDDVGHTAVDAVLTELEHAFGLRCESAENTDEFVEQLLPFEEHADDDSGHRSLWTYTSDTLHSSRKRRLRDVHDAQVKIFELLGLDAHTDERGRTLPDDHRARINRMYEIIFYAHSLQECKQRVQQLVHTSYTNCSPIILVEKLFRPRNPEQKLSPYQRCIVSALERLSLRRLRKYNGSVYEAISVNGRYTYAWQRLCTIKEWVWAEVGMASQTSFEIWDDATHSKGNIEGLISYLEACQDTEFPVLKKNRRILSFRNGVYITAIWDATRKEWRDQFCAYGTDDMQNVADLTADGSVAAIFHDNDFPTSVPTNVDDIIPNLMQIMHHQEWPRDVEWWLRAFIGRMLHPIGGPMALDAWQVIAMLLGMGNTGKSTIINAVIALFFDSEDTFFVNNNMEKQYGWSGLAGKYVWLAPEIKADFAQHTDQAQWQQLVCAERFQAAKKYKDALQLLPEEIPTGMMAGNENIDFHDNGSSVSRRRVDWYFGNPVTVVDQSLPQKLQQEIPAIICICNRTYLSAVKAVKGRIWNSLPRYFQDLQAENAEQTNALVHFLNNSSGLRFEESAYMLMTDFTRMYKNHCRDNAQTARSLNKDYYAGPFKSRRLSYSKGEHADPRDPTKRGKGPWVFGCCAIVSIDCDPAVAATSDTSAGTK